MKKNRLVKAGILLAAVLLLGLASNSSVFPFLGHNVNEALKNAFRHLAPSASFSFTVPRLIAAAAAVCILAAADLLIGWFLDRFTKTSRRVQTVTSVLKSFTKWIVWIIGIIWLLSIFGIDTSAAFAGVGIIALVVSFGAQSLVEDVVTGIFIMFEGALNVGDIIVIDDFRGVVRSIGVRTTSLEDTGGNIKVVNNSDIRNFQNRSTNYSKAVCDIAISYRSDIEKAEAVIRKISQRLYQDARDIFICEPEYAGVQELADSGVVLRITAEVEEENIFIAQRKLNREMKLAFDKYGIEIPFPQVVIHKEK